jgi:septal ring factor EnvC (AmiA/AmiB activator)
MARFYKTPYVQNIPDYGYELPFNEILAGLNQKQEKFDEVADLPDAINEQLLKITPYFSEDKEALQVYTSNLNKEMDDLIASVNGDYSKLGPQFKKIARKVNSDLNQGDLAQIQSNTEGAKKNIRS